MASNISIRSLRAAVCPNCRSFARPSPGSIASVAAFSRRGQSTSTSAPAEAADVGGQKPRWSYTPPLAKAPFSLRLNSKRPEFPVNSDPKVLDEFYIRLLGDGGDKVLSEEVKWLAVTHKSFDQGRRGFNDRLAFLGKRIVQLQASMVLAQSAKKTPTTEDPFGRTPFSHPALDGLTNLSSDKKNFLTSKLKLAELADKYELQKVLRWSPRNPEDLHFSGLELVQAHTLYAIVGAIALEQGGVVANKIARKRILEPLGVKIVS
ncbi:hypothetical protein MPDQ_002963 [Monascus purpureus]|uniref:RNase III domain-containing protein n=1 Tax=Monascus purpureus TaxID=5098 RepID=A0A507R625_MONPU|nr:hypothetical protein MPDQ_002963 [Monascus purpureus]BDD59477.1 hypothetical protein MAP00_004684 [Monascus purpureus]